jgi:hypothetical protein
MDEDRITGKAMEHLDLNLRALMYVDELPKELVFRIQSLAKDLDPYVAKTLLTND